MNLTVENIFIFYSIPICLIYLYLFFIYKNKKIDKNLFKNRIILVSIVFLYSMILYLKPLFFNNLNISILSFIFFIIYCVVSVKLRKDIYKS